MTENGLVNGADKRRNEILRRRLNKVHKAKTMTRAAFGPQSSTALTLPLPENLCGTV